jgi:hypothetical protein
MDWFETALKVLVVLGGAGVTLGLLASAVRIALGRTSTRRMLLGSAILQRHDPGTDREMADLRQTVERLGGDVAELQERLDFTERMLAQQRERQPLPGAADAAVRRSS